jgi:hypothetical protein
MHGAFTDRTTTSAQVFLAGQPIVLDFVGTRPALSARLVHRDSVCCMKKREVLYYGVFLGRGWVGCKQPTPHERTIITENRKLFGAVQ